MARRMLCGSWRAPPMRKRKSRRAATVKQMRAIEFEAEPRLAAVPVLAIRSVVGRIFHASIIAGGIATYSKRALVQLVAQNYDTLGPWLMELHERAEDARAIADVIEAAAARLAVALAVVEES